MTLPELPASPHALADDLKRRSLALSSACQFARMTPDDHAFRTMLVALSQFSTDDIKSAVANIALDPPSIASWVPSAEIAKRVKAARFDRSLIWSAAQAGKRTEPELRAPPAFVEAVVAKVAAADAADGGPERRRFEGEPTAAELREAQVHTAELRRKLEARGFKVIPADASRPQRRRPRARGARGDDVDHRARPDGGRDAR